MSIKISLKKNISEKNIKEAEMIYNKIINKSNINNKTLKIIKKKITNDNKVILGFLKNDLKLYNSKYKDEASKVLEQLIKIYNKLN